METEKMDLCDVVDVNLDTLYTIRGIESLVGCLYDSEINGSCDAERALPAIMRLLSDCEADIAKTQEALNAIREERKANTDADISGIEVLSA